MGNGKWEREKGLRVFSLVPISHFPLPTSYFLQLHLSPLPARQVLVGLNDQLRIQHQLAAFELDRMTIHVPSRSTRDESSIGPILGLVLGALEPVVRRQPLERGVLVGTR